MSRRQSQGARRWRNLSKRELQRRRLQRLAEWRDASNRRLRLFGKFIRAMNASDKRKIVFVVETTLNGI